MTDKPEQSIQTRLIRYADIGLLMEAFPQVAPGQFQQHQLDFMLGKVLMLVAVQPNDEADSAALGYLVLQWQSGFTPFWQRNMPEIIALGWVQTHPMQDIVGALLQACEQRVQARKHLAIGWNISAAALAPDVAAMWGYLPERSQEHLSKSLK